MVRRVRAGEAERLCRIAVEAKSSWGYPPDWLVLWAPELQVSEQDIVERPAWAVDRDGTVVAFTMLSAPGADAELEHLWVLPEYMGCGHGSALLTTALAYCREQGHGQVLDVSDPNAEAFYLARGARRSAAMASLPRPRQLPVLVFDL